MKIERPRSRQPLPDHAKLVFKGVMFDVYQWEQKLYDGSSATFERLKRPDTVMVIPVTEDGRIIITRQEQPGRAASFCLPGGRVDEAEDVLSAAKRELMEETGYESETWSLWDSQQPVLKIEWAIFTFVARGCRKTAGLTLDAGEKINLQDVSFEEFVELIVNGDFSDHELVPRFLRARLHPNGMEDLKREILG
ncbi:MAG: NUDIX hydrolase [bacterium]